MLKNSQILKFCENDQPYSISVQYLPVLVLEQLGITDEGKEAQAFFGSASI